MEGFNQLGSISMINNRGEKKEKERKKNCCRENKNCRKITTIYFGYTLWQWECQGEKSVNFKVTLVHVTIQARNMTCKEHKTHKHYRMKTRTQREFLDN
jgi:hypothetical protein